MENYFINLRLDRDLERRIKTKAAQLGLKPTSFVRMIVATELNKGGGDERR